MNIILKIILSIGAGLVLGLLLTASVFLFSIFFAGIFDILKKEDHE